MLPHPWIYNQNDYEAILNCLNNPSPWPSDSILRAFQTFDWNDASHDGDELAFIHETSGVIVKYDGQTLAIELGMGNLSEALPDLIKVLSQLGWEEAEVYHPLKSMDALLRHIGQAIPASMVFNFKPAVNDNFSLNNLTEILTDEDKVIIESLSDMSQAPQYNMQSRIILADDDQPSEQPPALHANNNYVVKQVNVGNSTFIVNRQKWPPILTDSVLTQSGGQFDNIIHINPGQANGKFRWNVIGEVPLDYPTFAETLISKMGFASDNDWVLACIINTLIKSTIKPQLRDLLSSCWSDPTISNNRFQTLFPTLAHLLSDDQIAHLNGSIASRLGPLLQCEYGQSFLDVRGGDFDLDNSHPTIFSLREISKIDTANLYIVHLNKFDGNSVTWIVDFLFAIAMMYHEN
jgi:hypothetical protein